MGSDEGLVCAAPHLTSTVDDQTTQEVPNKFLKPRPPHHHLNAGVHATVRTWIYSSSLQPSTSLPGSSASPTPASHATHTHQAASPTSPQPSPHGPTTASWAVTMDDSTISFPEGATGWIRGIGWVYHRGVGIIGGDTPQSYTHAYQLIPQPDAPFEAQPPTPDVGWIQRSQQQVRSATYSLPPALLCAARRSGTSDTIDVEAIEAHYAHTCPCYAAPQDCMAGKDGECGHPGCPQLHDGEPRHSGRTCPLSLCACYLPIHSYEGDPDSSCSGARIPPDSAIPDPAVHCHNYYDVTVGQICCVCKEQVQVKWSGIGCRCGHTWRCD